MFLRYDLIIGVIVAVIVLVVGLYKYKVGSPSKYSKLFIIIGIIGIASCLTQYYLSRK